MVLRICFKGYFPTSAYRDLAVPSNTKLGKNGFIRVNSENNKKILFELYKEDMQQGLPITDSNLGYSIIKMTGYFDLCKRHYWTTFNDFIGEIVYRYEIKEDHLELTPLDMSNRALLPDDKEIVDV